MHIPFTEFKEIEEPEVKSTVPPEIEELILQSFGHSILEFEGTLYMKFLKLTNGLVVTCQEFKDHLKNMEERGIVIETEFLGKRCWAMGANEEIRSYSSW
ncbi:hypothetical protein EU528_10015 [Candidatus Thorarchaeota archaeon]|nr:MAG: hypothetical protein EU528_10015 [Candidatus Thorarchaeota archaeon]